jgi:hypothetical protein
LTLIRLDDAIKEFDGCVMARDAAAKTELAKKNKAETAEPVAETVETQSPPVAVDVYDDL